MDTAAIITRILSEKVHLTVKELLALAPEVRKYFKETTTTKRLPALPTAEAHTVSTYSLGAGRDLLEAEPTLPLRTLDVILDGTVSVTGILDSSCQVVIIRRDVWEKLGAPLKHKRAMFMESTNGQANVTMGTCYDSFQAQSRTRPCACSAPDRPPTFHH